MPDLETAQKKHLKKDFDAILREAKRIANQKNKKAANKTSQDHLSKAKGGGDISPKARIPEENVSSILNRSAVNQTQEDQGEENKEEEKSQQSEEENQPDKVPSGGEPNAEQQLKGKQKKAQKAKKLKKAAAIKAKIDKAKKLKKKIKEMEKLWGVISFIFGTWWIWLGL